MSGNLQDHLGSCGGILTGVLQVSPSDHHYSGLETESLWGGLEPVSVVAFGLCDSPAALFGAQPAERLGVCLQSLTIPGDHSVLGLLCSACPVCNTIKGLCTKLMSKLY